MGHRPVVKDTLQGGRAEKTPSGSVQGEREESPEPRRPLPVVDDGTLDDEDTQPFFAEAMADYVGVEADELSFRRGDVVLVMVSTSQWWVARGSEGAEGLVPSNFFAKLEENPSVAQRLARSKTPHGQRSG